MSTRDTSIPQLIISVLVIVGFLAVVTAVAFTVSEVVR